MKTRVLLVVPFFAVAACDRAPVSSSTPAGSALPAAQQSAHYSAIDAHLDRGGMMYGYVDVEGDLASLAQSGQKLYEEFAKAQPGQLPEGLDIKGIIQELGLQGVAAAGMSSVKLGDGAYRNKTYLHTPNGRNGLLKLIGSEAKDFQILSLAPAKSDVVVEQEFDLSALLEVAEGVAKRLPAEPQTQVLQALKMPLPIPNVALTATDILQKSKGRLLVCAAIVDGQKLPIPNAPIEFPAIDVMIGLQGMGWLFTELQKLIPPADQGGPRMEEGPDFVKLTVPIPEGQLGIYQPLAYFDKKSDTLFIASRPAYLESCRSSGGPKVSSDAEFQTAMKGLPTKGNGMRFVTAKGISSYIDFVKQAMNADPSPGLPKGFMEQVMTWFMPAGTSGAAEVTTCEKEGILSVSNAQQSVKTLAASVVLTPAILATVAVPTIGKAKAQASLVPKLANVRELVQALHDYAGDEQGNLPEGVDSLYPGQLDLGGVAKLFEKGLQYYPGLTDKSEPGTMVVALPQPGGTVVVGFLDGTARAVPQAEFEQLSQATQAITNKPPQVWP